MKNTQRKIVTITMDKLIHEALRRKALEMSLSSNIHIPISTLIEHALCSAYPDIMKVLPKDPHV